MKFQQFFAIDASPLPQQCQQYPPLHSDQDKVKCAQLVKNTFGGFECRKKWVSCCPFVLFTT